jgi:hypothetical protein
MGLALRIASTCALLAVPAIASATGTVKGHVTFQGEPPVPAKITPLTDEAICGQQGLVDESLLVDPKSHGIKDVVVWIEKTKAEPPKSDPILDNWHCHYEPHVLVVPANQTIVVRNKDRFLHTTLARDPKGKQLFNVAIPNKDQEIKKTLPGPGRYALSCEVHAWMKGWVVVTNGELSAVTDASGTFEILGVPGGKMKLHFWQESLGERTLDVDVQQGKPIEVNVEWGKS